MIKNKTIKPVLLYNCKTGTFYKLNLKKIERSLSKILVFSKSYRYVSGRSSKMCWLSYRRSGIVKVKNCGLKASHPFGTVSSEKKGCVKFGRPVNIQSVKAPSKLLSVIQYGLIIRVVLEYTL